MIDLHSPGSGTCRTAYGSGTERECTQRGQETLHVIQQNAVRGAALQGGLISAACYTGSATGRYPGEVGFPWRRQDLRPFYTIKPAGLCKEIKNLAVKPGSALSWRSPPGRQRSHSGHLRIPKGVGPNSHSCAIRYLHISPGSINILLLVGVPWFCPVRVDGNGD